MTRSTRLALVGAGVVVVVVAARKRRRRRGYLSPGVYVEEVPSASKPIEGVGTSVAAFVGLAPGGPVNTPMRWPIFTLGLISDTHGLLRPEVLDTFAGVAHIVHAGDVGTDDVLEQLEAIAPVSAVAGNVDGTLRRRLPETAELELAGMRVGVIHGQQLSRRTAAVAAARFPGADLVAFGHSHVPSVERVGTTLAVNPGSAGHRRFGGPVTVALALVAHGRVEARIVELG